VAPRDEQNQSFAQRAPRFRVKAVILGATKGMGRAVARALVERGDRVLLLGHEPDELEASARDLEQRTKPGSGERLAGERSVKFAHCNLEEPAGFGPALDQAEVGLAGFDCVLVTAALYGTQDQLERDRARTRRLLQANFVNTVLFCEEARERLLQRGGGTLCVWSSVAGERGRKPVILYGASKAGLSAYLEGLDHKFHDQGLRVLCVKPGFVKTSMTEGLKPPPFAGEPEGVARDVLHALDGQKPVLYTPRIWALVMLVIRLLPRFVMRRIGF
jgi:NAD(P)-dependent dehydrogenase (short-subunit alcohol dehydrogenase family)